MKCELKVKHSKLTAMLSLSKRSKHSHEKLRIYFCNKCKYYHLTKKEKL